MVRSTTQLATLMLILALVGCSSQSAPSTAEAEHDEHAHETGGPHGGAIIELGEYHAELVHDDAAETVTVYILDGGATKNVPIDATEATINITHGGEGEQFKLAASPLDGEPDGWSSRFVSSDSHLTSDLDEPDVGAQFVVTINGQQHRGTIEHHHDGDDHEAGHDDHSHD